MAPLKLLITGPPNAGKGTLCERITKQYGVVHISTGNLLREHVKRGTSLGKAAQAIMAEGKLVPDDLMLELILAKMSEAEEIQTMGLLLDGFPRTGVQAHALINAGISFDAMIVLDVDDDKLLERCVGRRIDPVTGYSYHVRFKPPPTKEIEQRCVKRSDDTPEKLKTRLMYYKMEKDALMTAFASIKLSLDANQDIDSVFDQFNKSIGELLTRNARRRMLQLSIVAAKKAKRKQLNKNRSKSNKAGQRTSNRSKL